ncbi:MAG: alkaline phosphatase family protein [Ignavibacteriae bacterium]|nr:alkaline phosphatase family protein [Ignavibacteriota bacterium]
MKNKLLVSFVFFLTSFNLLAQDSLLKSGPMVGYSTMREVKMWVQTTSAADVKIIYWDKKDSTQTFETETFATIKQNAYIVQPIADQIEPGIKYQYELYINNNKVDRPYPLEFQTQVLWQWRTDPPKFKFATGSGAFINEAVYDRPKPYGGDYEIYTSIYNQHPDFMLWLGDNFYLREADFNSRTGILKRMTHDRATAEMQSLFGSVHHYAIWDDHEFGPNNSDRSFWNKETTLEAFKLFWANPSYGINGNPGTTTMFQWADADFFLLDNRYYRAPNDRKLNKDGMLGDEQLQWLIDALIFSHAPFKFIAIGGQFLNPNAGGENHSTYLKERNRILAEIEAEGIEGVIFLTGDVHRSELSKLEREGTYPLYDFTISPFTSGPSTWKNPKNSLRIEGTLVQKRNYAIFEFDGPRKDRNLKCSVYDKDGKLFWNYSIKASELKNKK